MKKVLIVLGIFAVAGFSQLSAQQLVYKAVNPNFGGDTFNYQFLLQSAQAQNSFTDPNAAASGRLGDGLSDLDRFSENLNRQLLNQITRNLFTNQFGADGNLTPGTFNFGDLVIEIFQSAEGLVVDILDITNGDQTQIIIPN